MEFLIRFLLSNFTLNLFILGLIVSVISLARKPRPWGARLIVEEVFAYFLFFSIGVSFFYNFIMHVFFGEMTAKFIGWEDSPFQVEVGTASLGFSLVGFFAFRGSFGMRAAAVLGPSMFLLGAAVGHIHQMVIAHNYAPGNAGVIFYTDILLPLVGFLLLWLQHKLTRNSEKQSER